MYPDERLKNGKRQQSTIINDLNFNVVSHVLSLEWIFKDSVTTEIVVHFLLVHYFYHYLPG